jgi:hypothetical protein
MSLPRKSIPANPYTTGGVVRTPEMFFGREDVIEWVRRNLRGENARNALVLHGQRRIGKTSLLFHLPAILSEEPLIFFRFDMQVFCQADLSTLLYEMARDVSSELRRSAVDGPVPILNQFSRHPERRFRSFCAELAQVLPEKTVVLMIDEFDILIERVEQKEFDSTVYCLMRQLIENVGNVSFVFAGSYQLGRAVRESKSVLFATARDFTVSQLDVHAARSLVTTPLEGLVHFEELAVDRILQLTGCHPYYIQWLCGQLVDRAMRERKNHIELDDVNEVADSEMAWAATSLCALNYELSRPEQAALAALAFSTDDWQPSAPLSDLSGTLARYEIPDLDLVCALRRLEDRDLVAVRREGQQVCYTIKVGLMRQWLKRTGSLIGLKEELQ